MAIAYEQKGFPKIDHDPLWVNLMDEYEEHTYLCVLVNSYGIACILLYVGNQVIIGEHMLNIKKVKSLSAIKAQNQDDGAHYFIGLAESCSPNATIS